MKKNVVTILIILGVIIISLYVLTRNNEGVDEELAKCIGQNSQLYIQLGCHACETQEKMFGKSYKHLNTIDCFYEQEKCIGIQSTPTWVINQERHTGVQNIDELKDLTGC